MNSEKTRFLKVTSLVCDFSLGFTCIFLLLYLFLFSYSPPNGILTFVPLALFAFLFLFISKAIIIGIHRRMHLILLPLKLEFLLLLVYALILGSLYIFKIGNLKPFFHPFYLAWGILILVLSVWILSAIYFTRKEISKPLGWGYTLGILLLNAFLIHPKLAIAAFPIILIATIIAYNEPVNDRK